mmetsp:Transcript_8238/g.10787  ORF Transcript_8238/g.10787 Transcript_8238/m.10787 type:complete len:227 (-) Transcript_8238:82-762(-)|eukprot:CAMPEP_0198143106 /NCGR_PEP_ID=MMETSP1443-20131203/5791_1 /TAXON_ID=186043 /ORGANISM="Entomoneis sp., Strain CCMP2396" /LENGTH=226 /DNA_ID=CAMNT_0043806249 /DNA_START=133 /DNA_END=813 /DNA_ORIENTATION=+
MSWKANLSRHLKILRFFGCPESPSSRGVMTWYTEQLPVLEYLNPNMELFMRTTYNGMPAVTTELDWTTQHVLKYMLQTGRFRDPNGTISEAREEAAKAYLAIDWNEVVIQRFKSPGFDPEKPYLDVDYPEWKDDPKIQKDLATYFAMKNSMEEQVSVFESGPNGEWHRAERAITMCQRVDLWCAGPKEVERAVVHLYKLGRSLNSLDADLPPFILDFHPGQDDMLP